MLTGHRGTGRVKGVDVAGACEFLPTHALRPRPADFLGPGMRIGLYRRILKKYSQLIDSVVIQVDYDAIWRRALSVRRVLPVQYRGAFVSWDNTPRKGVRGLVVRGATPERYRFWLERQLRRTRRDHLQAPFVFLNAWNEWAEGAYLEPDRGRGYRYLEATKQALDAA